MTVQRLGGRRRAVFRQEEELGRGERHEQRVLDGANERRAVGPRPVEYGDKRCRLGVRHRTAERAGRESSNDTRRRLAGLVSDLRLGAAAALAALRVTAALGAADWLAVRRGENVSVRGGRPSIVQRPLELDRLHEQPGHVAAVGEFAPHADFAHAREVVDVVLLHVGTGEVADRPFKHETLGRRGDDRLRGADRRERAPAVASQSQMDAHSRHTPLECREAFGERIVVGQFREGDSPRRFAARLFRGDRQGTGGQLNDNERGVGERSGKTAVAERQFQLFRIVARRRGEFAAWLDERLDFALFERSAVKPHFVQFTCERLRILNASKVQIDLRIVQVQRPHSAAGNQIAVDIQPRFARLPAHHRRDMLPSVRAQLARRRGHCAVRLAQRSHRLDPQHAPVVRHVQIPTLRPGVFAKADDAALPQLPRMNPSGDGKISRGDIHGRRSRHDQRIAIAIQLQPLAKRRGHEPRVARQAALERRGRILDTFRAVFLAALRAVLPAVLRAAVRIAVCGAVRGIVRRATGIALGGAVQRPGADQAFGQPAVVGRGGLRRGRQRVDMHEIDAGAGNLRGAGFGQVVDSDCRGPALSRVGGRLGGGDQQAVVVLRGGHGDAEPSVVRQFPQRDLEIGFGTVGAFAIELLFVRDRGPQEQAFRHGRVGLAFGVAGTAAKAGEHRVVNAVEVPPRADRIVADIAFDESVLRSHPERFEGEWLLRRQFHHLEILVAEQQAVRSQNQPVRTRRRIDCRPEVHAEVLNDRLASRIDDRPFERLLGDLEIRLQQQRRQRERFAIVQKTLARDRVRRQDVRQIVVDQQQFAERVAVLGGGQAAHAAVLGKRTGTRRVDRLFNPVREPAPLVRGRLRFVLGRHRFANHLLADRLPQPHVAIFKRRSQLVNTDT